MLKKIFSYLLLLAFILTNNIVNAAPAPTTPTKTAIAEFTNIRWSVHKDDKAKSRTTRIVIDSTGPLTLANSFETGTLTITAKGVRPGKNAGLVPIKTANIRKFTISQSGVDNTVLTITLNKKLTKEDFNAFFLRKDPANKKPDRLVIDIFEQKSANGNTAAPPAGSKFSFASKSDAPLSGKLIAIDPGHGGSDPGAIGRKTKLYEKNATLDISKKVHALLLQKGAIVKMTRTTDVDVHGPSATDAQELQARVDVADKNNAHIFVSIHINSSTSAEIGGTSTYYTPKTPQDAILAQCIQNKLIEFGGLNNLGIRQAGFYVTKRSKMPAALLELAFISNEREEKLLASNWFQNKLTYGIVAGIEDYFKQQDAGGVKK